MATSGTNYTGKWTLSNGVLTLSPVSGNSGQFRTGFSYFGGNLIDFITLTAEERNSVTSIVFTPTVSFWMERIDGSSYFQLHMYLDFIRDSGSGEEVFPNLKDVDVTGFNVSGGTDFRRLFERLDTLTGLSNLDVSAGTNFGEMFVYAKLSSLDVSHFPLTSATNIYRMFYGMDYCATITLPSDFSRTSTGDTTYPYYFGLAPATNANGITVRKDEDFFKLPSGQQGGTWTRDISGTATLVFRVTTMMRDGDTADIDYYYATSSATATVYLKRSSESSFPSTPTTTFTLTGTGNGTVTVTLPTDDSYDAWIIVTDGNETIYTYPSIDSNKLLMSIDDGGSLLVNAGIHAGGVISAMGSFITETDVVAEGDITAGGDITDGEGYSIPHAEEGTTSISTTTGVLNSHEIVRYGRVRMLRLAVQKSSATAVGSNLYVGKINTEADKPMANSYGSGYIGSSGVIIHIAPAGDITVRVIGAQIAANNAPWLGCTYIAQGD